MSEQTQAILRNSKDPEELRRTAAAVAAGESAEDLAVLAERLTSQDFLDRLDSADHYKGSTADLRLGQVIDALAHNRRPAAEKVLLSLTDNRVYQGQILRLQLLIPALANIRPSPPPAIAFWDKMSQAESPLAVDVIEALCVNQSPPAVDLFERKLGDPKHGASVKQTWLRLSLLPRRNDEPLLLASERLLKGSLPKEVQESLVESLFDYHEAWYRGCDVIKPPLRAAATATAKEVMRRLVELALTKVGVTGALKGAVEAVRKELGESRK